MDGLKLIEENEKGEKLYKLENDMFNTVVLVDETGEYCLKDMQSNDYPETLEDATHYDWMSLSDIMEWHE